MGNVCRDLLAINKPASHGTWSHGELWLRGRLHGSRYLHPSHSHCSSLTSSSTSARYRCCLSGRMCHPHLGFSMSISEHANFVMIPGKRQRTDARMAETDTLNAGSLVDFDLTSFPSRICCSSPFNRNVVFCDQELELVHKDQEEDDALRSHESWRLQMPLL